jgi:hypothetical protein
MVGRRHVPSDRRDFNADDGDRFVDRDNHFDLLFPVVFEKVKKRELPMSHFWKFVTVLAVLYVAMAQNTWACSVCFGDPNSPMTHGAIAGVAVLLGIVVGVMGGILAVAVFWNRRARLLRVQAALRGESVQL